MYNARHAATIKMTVNTLKMTDTLVKIAQKQFNSQNLLIFLIDNYYLRFIRFDDDSYIVIDKILFVFTIVICHVI